MFLSVVILLSLIVCLSFIVHQLSNCLSTGLILHLHLHARYQQQDLREVFSLSRSLHIQPIDPCALQARKHNRNLLADVRFLSVSTRCMGCVSRLASVSWRVSSSVRISTALKLICVSHATRLLSLWEQFTFRAENMQSNIVFHRLSSSTFSPHFLYACQPSSLEETEKRHLEVLRLSSL